MIFVYMTIPTFTLYICIYKLISHTPWQQNICLEITDSIVSYRMYGQNNKRIYLENWFYDDERNSKTILQKLDCTGNTS